MAGALPLLAVPFPLCLNSRPRFPQAVGREQAVERGPGAWGTNQVLGGQERVQRKGSKKDRGGEGKGEEDEVEREGHSRALALGHGASISKAWVRVTPATRRRNERVGCVCVFCLKSFYFGILVLPGKFCHGLCRAPDPPFCACAPLPAPPPRAMPEPEPDKLVLDQGSQGRRPSVSVITIQLGAARFLVREAAPEHLGTVC